MTDAELLDWFDNSGVSLSFTMYNDAGDPVFVHGETMRACLMCFKEALGEPEVNPDHMKLN